MAVERTLIGGRSPPAHLHVRAALEAAIDHLGVDTAAEFTLLLHPRA
jgi:hypothetical protein